MIYRGCIYILATLLIGLTSFKAFAESAPVEFDPEKLAQAFMRDVGNIQAETSIPELKNAKFSLQAMADILASSLDDKKAGVEYIRKKIKAVDDDIKSCHIRLAMAIVSGNTDTDEQEAQLKTLETERKQLVNDEKTAYKDYATFRGRAIVCKILFQLILNEIDKRIAQLGNNTASGTWTATFTTESGATLDPQGGDFSLVIDTNGIISGSYMDSEAIPVSGTWDPASGACQGIGSDPSSPSQWSGTLKKGPGGYTGKGSLSFKPKAGGSGSGSWSTR